MLSPNAERFAREHPRLARTIERIVMWPCRIRIRRGERNRIAAMKRFDELPLYLKPDDAADLLRTSRKAIYVMVERHQLPGVKRIGERLLIRRDDLLSWIDQRGAPSLQENER